MSDTSEDTISDRSNDINKEDSVCRDYVRGICDRNFCKYKHENESKMLNFCHDFQNSVCPRPHCKFIHCTPEEVEEYKRTGEMSNQILAEATRKNQLPGTPPVCNQFKKGQCRRNFCKFRHITKEQEDTEIMELIQNNIQRKSQVVTVNGLSESQLNVINITSGLQRRNGVSYEEYQDVGLSLPKRRFLSPHDDLEINASDQTRLRSIGFKGYFAGTPPPPMLSRADARTIMLEEENSMLHKEIAQLKQKVSDLTATNEFLLDQNANFRVSSKRNQAVNVPAVTIAQQQQQVIRTVTASVATVPVSLATVTSCNPVSGNPVSIAGCPAVSIASPAQLLAPSQQILVTTNPTTQLALANSSQAQLAIAQQNLANNLAQQAQPQLTSQAQQLALATTTQQLTSQAQHIANQQLALATTPQQLSTQPQQLTLQSNPQTLNQQLTSQAQQLANQQLTSQAQQLALANSTQQLTSQAQQLAMGNTQAQALAVASVPQQIALAASTNQQLIAQQNQQLELHRTNPLNAINTSQAIAMSNASQPMVSYPIMTQSMNHALTH
ncbi:unnamed protein product [Brassicogethes aeneus]|uniref:C3H1-type domain-containing protein n=1 Tax=Brassicogethes aeneus TaxID=1431903 RepID=A0A9P0B8B1_BRAAE|nr:unnamed protein product [Brassicogethes aeneus]